MKEIGKTLPPPERSVKVKDISGLVLAQDVEPAAVLADSGAEMSNTEMEKEAKVIESKAPADESVQSIMFSVSRLSSV